MRRFGSLLLGGFFFSFLFARAETSLDVLEQDLKEIKQEHETNSSKALVAFMSALEEASRSPDVALDLYQKAGGAMPRPAPVETQYEHETPDEKAVRLAADATNISNVASLVQVHCGLMRFALLFMEKPDAAGLRDEWLDWLKTTATIYPQLKESGLTGVPMRNSIISSYFGFRGWGEKEQGKWRVADLTSLYRSQVLDPLRSPPVPDVLAAWDTYILMRQADERDHDRWDQEEYPALQFERDSDDFALKPSTEKATTLVALIKACPTHSQMSDWVTRVQGMLETLRPKTGAAPTSENRATDTSTSTNTSSSDTPITNTVSETPTP